MPFPVLRLRYSTGWSFLSQTWSFTYAVAITTGVTNLVVLAPIFIILLRGEERINREMLHAHSYLGLIILWEISCDAFWPRASGGLVFKEPQDWVRYLTRLDDHLRNERSPPKDTVAGVLGPWSEILLGLRSETVLHIAFLCLQVLMSTYFYLIFPKAFTH